VSEMLIRSLRHVIKCPTFSPVLVRFQSTKVSKPLRILFCGSDEFASASLKAMHAEQQKDPERIASIDVLCRPGKPSGRGLKFTREGTWSMSSVMFSWAHMKQYQ
jgi:methionyl-tRNA formyltransferase